MTIGREPIFAAGTTPIAGAAAGSGRTSDAAELLGMGNTATVVGTMTFDAEGAEAISGAIGVASSAIPATVFTVSKEAVVNAKSALVLPPPQADKATTSAVRHVLKMVRILPLGKTSSESRAALQGTKNEALTLRGFRPDECAT